MKFLFNLFGNKRKDDQVAVAQEEDPIVLEKEFHHYKDNDVEVNYTLKVGDDVISVSNEPYSVKKGVIVRFEAITKARNIVPIVEYEGEGEFMCLSTLLPFDQEKYDFLLDLSKDGSHSAWNYVSPSWAQLSTGKIFRETKDSVIESIRNLSDGE